MLFPTFIDRYTNKDNGEEKRTRLKSIPCNQVVSKDKIDIRSFNTFNLICTDLSEIADKTLKRDYTTSESSIIGFFY